jgi:hypothetical protein
MPRVTRDNPYRHSTWPPSLLTSKSLDSSHSSSASSLVPDASPLPDCQNCSPCSQDARVTPPLVSVTPCQLSLVPLTSGRHSTARTAVAAHITTMCEDTNMPLEREIRTTQHHLLSPSPLCHLAANPAALVHKRAMSPPQPHGTQLAFVHACNLLSLPLLNLTPRRK